MNLTFLLLLVRSVMALDENEQLTFYSSGCDNAQLVSALDSDDAGTMNMGQVFTNGFPFELVNAAFGQELASEDVKSKIPPVGTGSNWGPESCLKECGVNKPQGGGGE